MAVLTKEEFFERLKGRIGDDSSDETISFLEDMTDTYNDFETRLKGDGVDWEAKYRELDESWKKRYRHRFFTGESAPMTTDEEETQEYRPEEVSIEDLFVKED